MSKILVIDDEKSIRNSLKDVLEYEKYKIEEAEDGMQGLSMIQNNNYDLILCDIKMPKMDGIDVLEMALEKKPESLFVMISGHGTIETAVEALKKGAYDFLEKPIDLNRLLVTVRNAFDKKGLQEETKKLKRKINAKKTTEIIGQSKVINEIKELIEKVAPSEARVLITGNNGTGKELIARQIHELSNRNKGPFIEVNCAAIPSELIESELFGHEKGAFTSAHKQRLGKFEQAIGGTLFLDEIGDMSSSAQAKVLRALQEKKITRVGGEKEISVDVRVLAATNKDLKNEIKEGNFREDLYHRLSVILIKSPSLSDRLEDIELLVPHFVSQITEEQGLSKKRFTNQAILELQKYSWPGNIRECRNIVERLLILGGAEISNSDVSKYLK
jgi:DNA-binding NtrC family response regulator